MLMVTWDSVRNAINNWDDALDTIESRSDVNVAVLKLLMSIQHDMIKVKFDLLQDSKSTD